MASIRMFDQLVSLFLELNPGQTEALARGVVKRISRGNQAAVLADWKAEARRRSEEHRGTPSVERAVMPAVEESVRPAKVIRETKKPYTLLLPPSMLEALVERANVDGASVSHHIRTAIAAYLKGGK